MISLPRLSLAAKSRWGLAQSFKVLCIHICARDSLPEWSKGVDSSSTSASCVGSNPTAVILPSYFSLPRIYLKGCLLADCNCWYRVLNFYCFRSTCGLVAMTSASHAEGRQFDPGQVYSMKQILRYDTRCSFALEIIRHRTQLIHHEQASCFHITDLASISQFARVVKGVDLRSTAGNCAWVRTPQLTSILRDCRIALGVSFIVKHNLATYFLKFNFICAVRF